MRVSDSPRLRDHLDRGERGRETLRERERERESDSEIEVSFDAAADSESSDDAEKVSRV